MSGALHSARIYWLSLRDWDAEEVAKGLREAGWWSVQSTPQPFGMRTLILLVNDPMRCPPQGLLNLREVKRKRLLTAASEFIEAHPDLRLKLVEPTEIMQWLNGEEPLCQHPRSN